MKRLFAGSCFVLLALGRAEVYYYDKLEEGRREPKIHYYEPSEVHHYYTEGFGDSYTHRPPPPHPPPLYPNHPPISFSSFLETSEFHSVWAKHFQELSQKIPHPQKFPKNFPTFLEENSQNRPSDLGGAKPEPRFSSERVRGEWGAYKGDKPVETLQPPWAAAPDMSEFTLPEPPKPFPPPPAPSEGFQGPGRFYPPPPPLLPPPPPFPPPKPDSRTHFGPTSPYGGGAKGGAKDEKQDTEEATTKEKTDGDVKFREIFPSGEKPPQNFAENSGKFSENSRKLPENPDPFLEALKNALPKAIINPDHPPPPVLPPTNKNKNKNNFSGSPTRQKMVPRPAIWQEEAENFARKINHSNSDSKIESSRSGRRVREMPRDRREIHSALGKSPELNMYAP
ncbi:hypothetical protein AAMO2058_001221200 [Amorphochlora amoebiformis]